VREIAQGLWHWTARHDRIGEDVSSYYLANERVLIDPMVPAEGLEWFATNGPPQHAILSNRHHDRHAWRFREAYGCAVLCIRNGLYELEKRGEAEPFDFGDELPGGIRVHEVDAICPDETALHLDGVLALACADGVIRNGGVGPLTFVSDRYMDDAPRTKQGLREAYGRLLELDFEVLLLAHGEPVVGGGKEALRRFVSSDG
jgi:hypothetical protein